MNAFKKSAPFLLAVVLAGCMPVMSLHPLYTEEDLVFDEKLLGRWADPNEDPNAFWEFTRSEDSGQNSEKFYQLYLTNEEGKKVGSFTAGLLKLDSRLFLDASPNRLPGVEGELDDDAIWHFNALFLLPLHGFVKVESIKPRLALRMGNEEGLEKLLKEHPAAVAWDKVDNRVILTAKTKQLQEFVVKYADDERLFGEPMILVRQQPGEPNAPSP